MRILSLGLASLATALGAVAAASADASADVPACVPAGATVAAASGPLAVYPARNRLVACRDGATPRRQAVGVVQECDDDGCVNDYVIATTGSCVAVRSDVYDRYYGDSWGLRVFDVRQRRSWSFSLGVRPDYGTHLASPWPLPALALGPGCAVAYINSLGAGQATEVRTADAQGRFLQAKGTDIDPTSLRRVGTAITWTQAGATRTATLSGAPRWRRPG